jgi:DNA-binding ferritin-like protein
MMKKTITDAVLDELRKRTLIEQDDNQNDDDQITDEIENDEETSDHNEDFCEMVCALLHSQTQVHIFHLGVKGKGSYAAHKALQGYYEGIDALVDGIIESYQGKYGLLTNYKSFENESFKSIKQTIEYLKSLNDMIEEKRDCCDDSFIQNQIDTVQELIFSTLYKLRFLE